MKLWLWSAKYKRGDYFRWRACENYPGRIVFVEYVWGSDISFFRKGYSGFSEYTTMTIWEFERRIGPKVEISSIYAVAYQILECQEKQRKIDAHVARTSPGVIDVS